jgi:hypothetical protein
MTLVTANVLPQIPEEDLHSLRRVLAAFHLEPAQITCDPYGVVLDDCIELTHHFLDCGGWRSPTFSVWRRENGLRVDIGHFTTWTETIASAAAELVRVRVLKMLSPQLTTPSTTLS